MDSHRVSQAGNGQLRTRAISLPKGGGAIRGIGEKFGANPVTGTGSMTVPIFTSPGRSGFGPQLSLSYDSGAGNGPFGLGWNLSIPSITRKTDKGLPRYRHTESDIFVLSGAEDLVPALQQQGSEWVSKDVPPRARGGQLYDVALYRPRIEGLVARMERWTNQDDTTDVFWRSITKENIATFYGTDSHSRIADPHDPTRIFSWLICESYDDKGNAILYRYVDENSGGIPTDQAHERNRTSETRSANRYLKRIFYGNRKPIDRTSPPPDDPDWMFEALFDYGEGLIAPLPVPPGEHARVQLSDPEPPGDAWEVRQDAFSTFRAGFEVRTYRLCRRVLMLHHFEQELGVARCLVRSTDFIYNETPVASFITSVVQNGFRLDGATFITRSMPALEFEYSQATIDDTVQEVPLDSLENLPAGLESSLYELVDLDAEGSPGILNRQASGWFLKRNLSPITFTSKPSGQPLAEARFAPVEVVTSQPNAGAENAGNQQFLDLAGDGQVDLVDFGGAMPGFYERTYDENWEPFAPFASLPHLDWLDSNIKFIDLTGDGHTDILISEDDAFAWYASLAELGFGPSERVRKALEEEEGPRLVFADGTQSIYLADMSGDGLTDLVRIRNGEVCYWPNVGYGRFGTKVTMHNAPWFDRVDLFDQRRVRLADIDGSGVSDIIYWGSDGVDLYFNYSGNSWSTRHKLNTFPGTDNLSSVQAADLLGTGTACLVWSSPLPGDARRSMRYIDLMGGQKPHLLVKTVNNLGAETHVQYAPSTKFYLLDKRAGTPWITRLPFPVHVVERVETVDHISRSRFVTNYTYRHGYFDGAEREFRGFGLVEQLDTEAFGTLAGSHAPPATNIDPASHIPPVLTRTWFHTGLYLGRDRVSRFFAGLGNYAGEYYREPGLSDANAETLLLEDTILPTGLSNDEEREACRALKGSMLRQEVYALDGTGNLDYPFGHPYTVTEQNFTIEVIQPRGENQHAVFFVHPREVINYHYERHPTDPRVSHALTLELDPFGSVLRSLAIGYGRRDPDPDLPSPDQLKQTATLITYTENDVTNPIDEHVEHPDDYRAPLQSASRTYELTGFKPAAGARRFSFLELTKDAFGSLESATEIPYEAAADLTKKQKRLIDHVRTLYRSNDLTSLLPQGTVQSLALPGESYKLVFTPGLLTQVYRRTAANQPPEELLPDAPNILTGKGSDQGGYVDMDADGYWWMPSGLVFYDVEANVADPESTAGHELIEARGHFFLPRQFADPFDQVATVEYDGHDLLVTSTHDAVGNSVTAAYDYRVLQPKQVTDPNGNRSDAALDIFGLVAGTAVMGKEGEELGDTLSDFAADLTQAQVDAFYDADDPHTFAPDLLAGATTRVVYDVNRFRRTREAHPNDPSQWLPAYAATIARETHVSDLQGGPDSRIQVTFSYSDGFGREIQKKVQAEPGPLVEEGPEVSARWLGNGWTIFNNKGKPVRQYEPFFSQLAEKRHAFEFGAEVGVSPIIFYDPLQRVTATLHPNHTWEKVVFDAWRREAWDPSDTVTGDPRTDEDLKGLVLYPDGSPRLPTAQYLPTWQGLRTDPKHAAAANQNWPDPTTRNAEKTAAENAAVHANTPTVTHVDSLGRAFLVVAHNRFKRSDKPPADPPSEEFYRTRVTFDIEGNQREVRDSVVQAGDQLGRIVMQYDYDLLGNRVHQISMDAGERWTLSDVAGKPIRSWDARRFERRTTYDALRRPTGLFVSEGGAPEVLAEKTEYGETKPDPAATNHRGKVSRVLDGAGVLTNEEYDFKGNLARSSRQLLQDYKGQVNWLHNPSLESELFSSRTVYDALNRPVQFTAPHSDKPGTPINVVQPVYNEANLLEQVHAWLNQGAEPTRLLNLTTANLQAVTDIDYDAKGQRTLIEYGNGVRTTYEYDPLTFRLSHLRSRRNLTDFPDDCPQPPPTGWPGCQLQSLRYTYDPVGNITHIRDDAQQTIYFRNRRVEPSATYVYDAIYRLIEATGREHLGQLNGGLPPPTPTSHVDAPRVGLLHRGDGNAMGNYLESYEYDAAGNIIGVTHGSPSGGWNRNYHYDAFSLIESGKPSNRLTRSTVGATTNPFTHDAHGNMTSMPHLASMEWDFEDQLHTVDLGGGGSAYFTYDAAGQRTRKVWEKSPGTVEERIYLEGFEIFRRRDGGGVITFERETLHVLDDRQRIALIETKTIDGHLPANALPSRLTRYQFNNHLGSASLELDDQAQIISYEEHYPYGSTSYQAVRSGLEVSAKRYRYTGNERDEETRFYYHGARYYAPWLGRWASCDPAGTVDGPSLYAYGRCNPVRHVDAHGTQSNEPTEPKQLTPSEAAKVQPQSQPSKAKPPEPLKLVFYNLTLGPRGGGRFATRAKELAEAIKSDGWNTETKALTKGRAIQAKDSILGQVQQISEQTGRKVSEIQIVGHSHWGLNLSASEARELKKYVTANVKIVFHGCLSCATPNVEVMKRGLFKELPGARVYGHDIKVDSGMPYGFVRVELKDGDVQRTKLERATPEVFPEDYVREWTRSTAKIIGIQPTKELFKSKLVEKDVREIAYKELDRLAAEKKK